MGGGWGLGWVGGGLELGWGWVGLGWVGPEILGIWVGLGANGYGLGWVKIRGISIFRWGRSPLLGLGYNNGKKPEILGICLHLGANTYGLNFIKIRGISILRGARSSTIREAYNNRPVMPIFKFWDIRLHVSVQYIQCVKFCDNRLRIGGI